MDQQEERPWQVAETGSMAGDCPHAMGQSIISPCSALCPGSGAGELHPPHKMLRRGVLGEAECVSHSA